MNNLMRRNEAAGSSLEGKRNTFRGGKDSMGKKEKDSTFSINVTRRLLGPTLLHPIKTVRLQEMSIFRVRYRHAVVRIR